MKDSIYPTYEVTPGFNLSQYRCNVTFLSMCFHLVRDISFSGISSKLDFFWENKSTEAKAPRTPVLDQPPSVVKWPINN